MNKNLFLALALCATMTSSLVVSMEAGPRSPVSSKDIETRDAKAPNAILKMPVAPSLFARCTTLTNNPLRVSTYIPGFEKYAGGWTSCVDAACLGVVGFGLGYSLYANRGALSSGGKSVASGVATVALATKSGLVSGAHAVPGLLSRGAGSAYSVAGSVSRAAAYPIKEACAHPTATAVGVGGGVALSGTSLYALLLYGDAQEAKAPISAQE